MYSSVSMTSLSTKELVHSSQLYGAILVHKIKVGLALLSLVSQIGNLSIKSQVGRIDENFSKNPGSIAN